MLFLVKLNPKFSSQALEEAKATKVLSSLRIKTIYYLVVSVGQGKRVNVRIKVHISNRAGILNSFSTNGILSLPGQQLSPHTHTSVCLLTPAWTSQILMV